jgi:hypothetical protein
MADDLRAALESLSPTTRDTLRHVLILDQADRDGIAAALLAFRDSAGYEWADVIDSLTLNPDARRHVVRLLTEIAAAED